MPAHRIENFLAQVLFRRWISIFCQCRIRFQIETGLNHFSGHVYKYVISYFSFSGYGKILEKKLILKNGRKAAKAIIAEIKVSGQSLWSNDQGSPDLDKLTRNKEFPIQRDAVSIYCKQVGVNQTVKLVPEIFSTNLIYNKPSEPNSLHYLEVSGPSRGVAISLNTRISLTFSIRFGISSSLPI